jgi:hypothetical protein
MNTIPCPFDIKSFLVQFFQIDGTPRYLGDYNDIVADHFGLSVEARETSVFDGGTNSHSTGDNTELGARVGRIVSQTLVTEGIVKLVGVNTYEGINGPDSEMVDSPGMKAARTRSGVSYIIPSVKILRTIKRFADDEALLIAELSTKFDPKLVAIAVEHVNKTSVH